MYFHSQKRQMFTVACLSLKLPSFDFYDVSEDIHRGTVLGGTDDCSGRKMDRKLILMQHYSIHVT